ncbi:carboxymuconolactone decarboxylase family protein [Micromonospora olivasterospora]|uniref:carboxymuconolactone decarboxylase family protein n=1 Tax=Micromonospora olivasterospora TaxID=1880 RepID=UPI0036CE7D58
MTSHPLRTLLGDLGFGQVRHVTPVRRGAAHGPVAEVYRQMDEDFGVLAPPVVLHSPAPDLLAAAWVMLRETVVADGVAPRAAKEAAVYGVSLGNACPYCVSVHRGTLRRLLRGAGDDLPSGALRDWGRAAASAAAAAGAAAPFPAAQAAEMVAVAVLTHYLNRVVSVFLTEAPLPPGVPRLALTPVSRVLGGRIGRAADRPRPPGASLRLLPAAPLPADLAWARASPTVAAALARSAAAVEAAASSVPAGARALVTTWLAGWGGEPPGISRAWADAAVRVLPPAERPAARLALLVAAAPYQVDDEAVGRFRRDRPEDRALLELCAWAALAAARRAASWIPAQS